MTMKSMSTPLLISLLFACNTEKPTDTGSGTTQPASEPSTIDTGSGQTAFEGPVSGSFLIYHVMDDMQNEIEEVKQKLEK